MARDRIVKAGAIVAPVEEVSAPLGVTIDETIVVEAQPDVESVVKAVRARKVVEAVEPRPATIAEMMAQSLQNHREHTDRAAVLAELNKQLKNL